MLESGRRIQVSKFLFFSTTGQYTAKIKKKTHHGTPRIKNPKNPTQSSLNGLNKSLGPDEGRIHETGYKSKEATHSRRKWDTWKEVWGALMLDVSPPPLSFPSSLPPPPSHSSFPGSPFPFLPLSTSSLSFLFPWLPFSTPPLLPPSSSFSLLFPWLPFSTPPHPSLLLLFLLDPPLPLCFSKLQFFFFCLFFFLFQFLIVCLTQGLTLSCLAWNLLCHWGSYHLVDIFSLYRQEEETGSLDVCANLWMY